MDMGVKENGSNNIFALKVFDPKTTPDQVTPGQAVCFQGYQNNWVYVKLLAQGKLSLAYSTGFCPTSFPESQATLWER